MRRPALLLLLPLALGAQVLDTIIRFPDQVNEMFYVPRGNKLYVNTCLNPVGYRTYIVNCSTYAVERALPDVGNTGWYWHAAWNWRRNKVYCVPCDDSALTIVDNATDSTLVTLPVVGAWQPLYNSRSDRVYVSGTYNGTAGIVVIDGATDSVLDVIPLGGGLRTIVWDSLENKVYAGHTWSRDVAVIDCGADTLRTTISSTVGWPNRGVYNPLHHKLYLGSDDDGGESVIDCIADTLIKDLGLDYAFSNWVSMVWDSIDDKVYWPGYLAIPQTDSLSVVDCVADSMVARLAPPGPYASMRSCCFVPWSDRVYLGSDGAPATLLVIDCTADTVLSLTSLTDWALPATLVANPNDRRVYMSVYWDSAVYVYRDELPGVAERQAGWAAGAGIALTPNPATGPVRVRWRLAAAGRVSAAVYDEAGRRAATVVERDCVAGPGYAVWDSRGLEPGVYFCRMRAGPVTRTEKLVLTGTR